MLTILFIAGLAVVLLGWVAIEAKRKVARVEALLYEPIAFGPNGVTITRADFLVSISNDVLQAAKVAEEQKREAAK